MLKMVKERAKVQIINEEILNSFPEWRGVECEICSQSFFHGKLQVYSLELGKFLTTLLDKEDVSVLSY